MRKEEGGVRHGRSKKGSGRGRMEGCEDCFTDPEEEDESCEGDNDDSDCNCCTDDLARLVGIG